MTQYAISAFLFGCPDFDLSSKAKAVMSYLAFRSMADNYNKVYKANSRETVRKQTLHQFVDGAVAQINVDYFGRATNSPKYSYCLADEMLTLLHSYGTNHWEKSLESFITNHETLMQRYRQQRESTRVPVIINECELSFSPGEHNQLQKAVIEDFAEIFAPGSIVLYIGDTENKDRVKDRDKLSELGVEITDHSWHCYLQKDKIITLPRLS